MQTFRSNGFLFLALLALSACAGTPGGTGTAPELSSTAPSDNASSVALNVKLAATFDQEMEPLSGSTFTLRQGSTNVPGTVAMTPNGTSARFTPSSPLSASVVYTATITTGARSSAGDAFAAERSWTFTTGTTSDTAAPAVSSTKPAAGATEVPTNSTVVVSFSEALDPLTVDAQSFTVKQGTTAVTGAVVYGPGNSAKFTASNRLATSSAYDVSLANSITDLSGNALPAFTLRFTTDSVSAMGPAPVQLGTAGNFAVLAKTGISSVPASVVTGDIGLGPAAATYLTGFSLVADATNAFATSTQLTGKAYAADYAVPTPTNLTTAVSNMEAAYTDASSRPTPDFLELSTGDLGGKTLVPGLYKWTSSVTVPGDVTLAGGANDVWILQTTGDLFLSATKKVVLTGGAQAKNVFWQVAGKATFGAGSHFEGILLCKTDVTLETGASMNGRILSQTQVALQQATVTQPAL